MWRVFDTLSSRGFAIPTLRSRWSLSMGLLRFSLFEAAKKSVFYQTRAFWDKKFWGQSVFRQEKFRGQSVFWDKKFRGQSVFWQKKFRGKGKKVVSLHPN